MKFDTTERGFRAGMFEDFNGEKCSLQKSSIATEDCIWLGPDDANPMIFTPHGNPAWQPMPMPELVAGGHVSFTTRMHLTREMVAELLPALHHFVNTGELPDPDTGPGEGES